MEDGQNIYMWKRMACCVSQLGGCTWETKYAYYVHTNAIHFSTTKILRINCSICSNSALCIFGIILFNVSRITAPSTPLDGYQAVKGIIFARCHCKPHKYLYKLCKEPNLSQKTHSMCTQGKCKWYNILP